MSPKNKFAALSATVVSGGALALANNIGFRGNCEIHESEPACNLVGADPLHTHQEAPSAYGTNTTTLTSGGGTLSLTGQGASITAGTGALTASSGDSAAPTYLPTVGIAVTPTYPQPTGLNVNVT